MFLRGGNTSIHTMDINNRSLNINQIKTGQVIQQVKCVLSFLIMSAVFEIISESIPP